MISGETALRLLSVPMILGIVYSSLRSWKKLNHDTGMDIVKKLKRGASLIEILENADEQVALRRERIRSLRDRARTDPRAARDLRRLLDIEIRAREQVLEETQTPDDSVSGLVEDAKSALSREILELKGIQQELSHLPPA